MDLNEIEILQVAIAHEERARRYYSRLAEVHGASEAGDLFAFLAGEEEGHIHKLSGKYGLPAFEAGWDAKFLPYLIDLEKLAWEEGVEAGGAGGADAVRRGLLIAKKAEAHAIAFYGQAARGPVDPATRDLLSGLEGEERLHLARIEEHLGRL